MKYSTFVFEDYGFDSSKNEATLKYSFDGTITFEEKIVWDVKSRPYNPKILESTLYGLWLMCGISYYKAFVPAKIIIKKGALSKNQKDFFDSIYLNGLAQFFYTNEIDWKGLIDFPYDEALSDGQKEIFQTNAQGSLVAIGGGKDSIVAAETLKKANEPFDCWAVNQAARFQPIADKLGVNMLGVHRTIDPKLLELNSQGALNGHVPITAINSFIGLVLLVLTNTKNLVWAIEYSTDEPNTSWHGLDVNHQYSKTSFFEQAMQEYIKENIASDIECYSILRPLSELRIAEIFCKNYIEKYQGIYSSCNANFAIGRQDDLKWCGKCPKCAFVFIIFSPFLEKEDLMRMFGGKNIFTDPEMRGTIEELLGIDGHKPLECVGEIAETRKAVEMSRNSGQYPELSQFQFDLKDFDYKKWHHSYMPNSISAKVKDILSKM